MTLLLNFLMIVCIFRLMSPAATLAPLISLSATISLQTLSLISTAIYTNTFSTAAESTK